MQKQFLGNIYFFSKYFKNSVILYILMIACETTHQNLSDYNHFLLKKYFKLIKNRFFVVKNWEPQVIASTIMLTRSSATIFNPTRYTGYIESWYFQYD